jgi:dCTP deaminase
MILGNREIIEAIKTGRIKIDGLNGIEDPSKPPFNTSSVDLRLSSELSIPFETTVSLDLVNSKAKIARYLTNNSKKESITLERPYRLNHGEFVLAQTIEKVDFPILDTPPRYSARIEGRSSYSRCGILVHFTAPTIHAGFRGPITLEIINFGPNPFLLSPGQYICQIIIEEVRGDIVLAPNQFMDQCTPAGLKKGE